MNILSESLTLVDTIAAQRYTQAFSNALTQGHEYGEASRIATNNLYSVLQTQSLLLSLKTLLGYVLIPALVITIVCCFIPFHKTLKVKVVKTGDDMV